MAAADLKPRHQYLVEAGPSRPAKGNVPSASKVFRNSVAADGFPTSDHTTLHELFSSSVAKFAAEPLLGWRPIDEATGKAAGEFEWMTYEQTAAAVGEVASGLAGLGLAAGNRVGVYGVNCPEWMIAMQVCGWLNMSLCEQGAAAFSCERHSV
jgi:long-chain acyl-CoA synthetase